MEAQCPKYEYHYYTNPIVLTALLEKANSWPDNINHSNNA